MNDRRVVITGLGVISPVGTGIDAVYEALLEGRSGVRRIEAFDPAGFDSQVGGEVGKLKMGDYVPKSYRKATKVMARDIELAVAAAYEAAKDARLRTKCLVERGEDADTDRIDSTRFGANIGAGLICADLNELAAALATAAGEDGEFDIRKWGSEGMSNLTPLWLLKFLPNMLACHVTIVHDAQGSSNTITCGEASSHLAIGEAFRTISHGSADICICGGAESKLNAMGLMRQSLLRRLAVDHNDDPASACRPFDVKHSGTVISEGAGLIILEALDHAEKRGARIYGELIGFGASANVKSWSQPDPEGRAIAVAVKKALDDAEITPDEIELVIPCGTGIPSCDVSEAKGLHATLGARASEVPVAAWKGAIGNNGAGSGAIDLAAAVMAAHKGTIPRSQNVEQVDPECDLNVLKDGPTKLSPKVVLSTAYALSGRQTAALIFKPTAG
ncbi:MAG: beta-ketoacyl-[acyl-carrier-protein] synthase family protein [Phycisphaerae bacterium]|nr:beta-ketoacyl-[acyl-carrier-protein] synthase family protein [Phycisphaerae bacterium]